MSYSRLLKRMPIARRQPAGAPPGGREPVDPAVAERNRRQATRVVTENPFRVLELSVDTSARDVEREGGRILALIAAGLDEPDEPRTAEQVREAITELSDPRRRALHEFFSISAKPPEVDAARVARQLAKIPLELPDMLPLHSLLQQLAGELVPPPGPLPTTPGVEAAMRAALEPTPLKVVPVCIDSLDLELE